MIVSRVNYFSLEVEREYMSRSQYLGFCECEAKEMAKLAGDWSDEKTDAFLVGSYVHSWNEQRRREFIADHPEMFTGKRELKAPFKIADKMIEALENDPLVMYTLQGDKEIVITAEFAGAPWKVMLDAYNPDRRRIVDLKTTKSIREKTWNPEIREKVSFIEAYNYPLQAALYSEIERLFSGREDWLDFFIVAVSKEAVPDKEIIDLRDPERYILELALIQERMPRILAVKAGEVEPVRCEACAYCRSTRRLTKAIHYSQL